MNTTRVLLLGCILIVVFETCCYFSSLSSPILQNNSHRGMFRGDCRFSSAPTEVSSRWVAVTRQIADVMTCLGWGDREFTGRIPTLCYSLVAKP